MLPAITLILAAIAVVGATPVALDVHSNDVTIDVTENALALDLAEDDVSLNVTESGLEKRAKKIFTFYERTWKHTSCGPNGTNCVSATNVVTVALGDCTNSCGATTTGFGNSDFCGKEFSLCGRKLTLKNSGESKSCHKLRNLNAGDNGRGYALLYEGSKKVGSCSIDINTHKFGSNCIASGAYGFQSRIHCAIN